METAVITGVAIIIKYFVIFDILTNFVSRVNVELSPYLQEKVDDIQKLEFPTLKFLEGTSLMNDGGGSED